jgi:hypothetical protein
MITGKESLVILYHHNAQILFSPFYAFVVFIFGVAFPFHEKSPHSVSLCIFISSLLSFIVLPFVRSGNRLPIPVSSLVDRK